MAPGLLYLLCEMLRAKMTELPMQVTTTAKKVSILISLRILLLWYGLDIVGRPGGLIDWYGTFSVNCPFSPQFRVPLAGHRKV